MEGCPREQTLLYFILQIESEASRARVRYKGKTKSSSTSYTSDT